MTQIKIATSQGTYLVEAKSEYNSNDQATTCPICSGNRKTTAHAKSLCGSLNMGKGVYHCNHCGVGGVVVTDDFVLNDKQVRPLANTFVISDFTEEWVRWLWNVRRITKETAHKMNLHVVQKTILWANVPEDYSEREKYIDQFVPTLCLAAFYVYHDVLVNVQYRDMWKNFAFEKGGDLVFFNSDIIRRNEIVMVTEGWMDAVACCEAGLENACSVPNGSSITNEERDIFNKTGTIEILSEPSLKYLVNCWGDFDKVKEVVLAMDDDAAGQKLLEVFRRRFTNAGKKVSKINFKQIQGELPHKDFNDVLIHYGKEAVQLLYKNREYFKSANVVMVKDVRQEIINHLEQGLQFARKVGWTGMDPHFGYFPGDIIVANGYPASGKTVVNQNLMTAISKKYGTRWLVYSPENYPPARFFEAIMEIYAGKTMDTKRNNSFVDKNRKAFQDATEWVNEHFRIANKNTPFMLPELRDLAIQEDCQGLFADPWNRMIRHPKHRGVNIDQFIQEELTEQISFGLATGCTSIISIHPPTQDKKSRKYDQDGKFDHPSAYEAEGGKVWFSSAHVMFCTHRPNASDLKSRETYIYTQKLKDWKLYGVPTGDMTPLVFKMQTTCRRLYLNDQSPLDDNSAIQKKIDYGQQQPDERDPDDRPF